MSIPVSATDLPAHLETYGPSAFLVTVGAGGAPHVVSVATRLSGEAFEMGAGTTSRANAAAHPSVTLMWPARAGDAYALLVDGEATAGPGDDDLTVAVTKGVLHRLTDAPGDGPSCVRLTPKS